jgi:hypothetical protein
LVVIAGAGVAGLTVLPRATWRFGCFEEALRLVAFFVVEEAGAVGAASVAGSASSFATCFCVVVRRRGAG